MKIVLRQRRNLQGGRSCEVLHTPGRTLVEVKGELEQRVAALEAQLSGFSEMSLDVCAGGDVETFTFLTK